MCISVQKYLISNGAESTFNLGPERPETCPYHLSTWIINKTLWWFVCCHIQNSSYCSKWNYIHVYMKDSEIGPVPQTWPIPQTCPSILWRQISTWESKNKPDSIVMSNSPKHVRFGPTSVPDFSKKQHYPSILCMLTIMSVFQCYYYTIHPQELDVLSIK